MMILLALSTLQLSKGICTRQYTVCRFVELCYLKLFCTQSCTQGDRDRNKVGEEWERERERERVYGLGLRA